MAFNSLSFWIFFSGVFIVYWLIPAKLNTLRKVFLIGVSYLLYMSWKPAFALVLLGITVTTFLGAYFLDGTEKKKRKRIFAASLIISLLPLLVFKYYNFINDSITDLLLTCGLKVDFPGLNWAIPMGISFYSFQAVGYLFDVHYRRTNVERSFFDYVLFVSFFPQVTSGPISKADELLPQIKSPRHFDYEQAKQGLKFLLWGAFVKFVIADRLGMYVDAVFNNYMYYNGSTCLLASFFYSFQIYCDFMGYSLIAIGVARTLGFNLINNFKRPYLAISITDFWKRWHISLTRWLTQNVYIPLGGNRCSKAKNYLNIMLTFLVSGIWHGANWTFIIWGMIHGVFQVIEKALGWQKYNGKSLFVRFSRVIVTFILVTIAWVFFRMPTVSGAVGLISKAFTNVGVPSLASVFDGFAPVLILAMGLAILIYKELSEEFGYRFATFHRSAVARWVEYVVLFAMVLSVGILDGGSFIYVSF